MRLLQELMSPDEYRQIVSQKQAKGKKSTKSKSRSSTSKAAPAKPQAGKQATPKPELVNKQNNGIEQLNLIESEQDETPDQNNAKTTEQDKHITRSRRRSSAAQSANDNLKEDQAGSKSSSVAPPILVSQMEAADEDLDDVEQYELDNDDFDDDDLEPEASESIAAIDPKILPRI
jgi:hypothetical protein